MPRPPGPTQETLDRAQAWLEELRKHPWDQKESSLQKLHGLDKTLLSRWRILIPGFRKEERRVRLRRGALREAARAQRRTLAEASAQQEERATVGAAVRAAADLATPPEAASAKPFEPRMQAFLDALGELDDRADALKAASIRSWQEVQDYAGSHPGFAAAYANVCKLQLFRVEDAVRRKGSKGDVKAAQIYLQATDPNRYESKTSVRHSGEVAVTAQDAQAQAHWLSTFRAGAKPVGELRAQAALVAGGEEEAAHG